jgi:O-antigen ligase
VAIVASPWFLGSANWQEQIYLTLLMILAGGLMLAEWGQRWWVGGNSEDFRLPAVSAILLAGALFASLQAIPWFSPHGPSSWAPRTIQLQRWFLGESNPAIAQQLRLADQAEASGHAIAGGAIEGLPKLALSVEPLHTRAAVAGLAMSALMVWIGATCFSTPRWQLVAMVTLTVLGTLVGVFGLIHILSWSQFNPFGLRADRSFAFFVSKNSAGGFLNLCLSAALGLATWAFLRPRTRDQRYSYGEESPAIRVIRYVEDALAQLTTPQIASVIAVAFLLACVLSTGSRGAAISAAAACFLTLLLSGFDKQNLGRWIFAAIVMLLGASLIVAFEIDQRLAKRFGLLLTSAAESQSQAGRLYIWGIAIQAFAFFWGTGSGLGTFHFSHLPFQHPSATGWYYHAESLYLQALVDLGWIGGLMVILIAYALIRGLRRIGGQLPKSQSKLSELKKNFAPIYVVGLTLVVSQGLHSFVDFALILPSLFLPASLLAGMVIGMYRQRLLFDQGRGVNFLAPESWGRPGGRETSGGGRWGGGAASLAEPSSGRSHQVSSQRMAGWEPASLMLAVLLLVSSLSSMWALARVKAMNAWLTRHEQVDPTLRVASPSAYLAGLWGHGWHLASIQQVPEALRLLAESVLYEFRTEKLDQLLEEAAGRRTVSNDETSPLLVRMAMADKERELAESTPPKPFDQLQGRDLLGGDKQFSRWTKARELILRAHYASPLDWQVAWDRLLVDPDIQIRRWNGWHDRVHQLTRHVPQKSFQLGLIARHAAEDRPRSEELWRETLQLDPSRTPTVASLFAIDTPDGEVPLSIFPATPSYLFQLLNNPFTAATFPKTHEQLWLALESSATQLARNDPWRGRWLSNVAAHFGRTDDELAFLEEAVRYSPLDRNLRLVWVDRLASLGELALAIKQAEFCLSLAPDDPQTAAVVKQLKDRQRAEDQSNAAPETEQ